MKITFEKLHNKYVNEGATLKETALFFNTTPSQIKYYLNKYGIASTVIRVDIPYEELYQKYIVEKIPQRALAKTYNTSQMVIRKFCNLYNLHRSKEENIQLNIKNMRKAWDTRHDEIVAKIADAAIRTARCPERLAKLKQTFQERYNADSVGGVPEFQKKAKETYIKNHGKIKHGAKTCLSNPEHRKKAVKAAVVKYGPKGPLGNTEVRTKIRQAQQANGFISRGEQEVFTFIKHLCPDAVQGDFSVLQNQELDIYIPSEQIAIEYNGVYWHSDNVLKTKPGIQTFANAKNYHYNKWLECKKQGIQLIHIWETEWETKKDIWQNKLKSLLQVNEQETVYARKCTVREISSQQKSKFLNEHHIQGNDRSNNNFGLFHNSKLVAVMSFRNSRSNQEIELSRYATACHIPGGFSKLLKASGHTNIYSWSDNRLSTGNMYLQTGWTKIKETKPDYMVSYNKQLFHKSSFRRSAIKKNFPEIYSERLTEFQMEDLIGALRIWDCGKIKWKFS